MTSSLQGSRQSFQILTHRITVANIVCAVVVNNTPLLGGLAIRNDNAWKNHGRIEFGAVGGGAKITAKGREILKRHTIKYDDLVQWQEVNDDVDARLTVYAESCEELIIKKHKLVNTLIDFASQRNGEFLEKSIERELREELLEDLPGILTEEQFMAMRGDLIGFHISPERTSTRGNETKCKTTPIALCYRLVIEDASVFDALIADPERRIRHLSPEEVATTWNGTTEGTTRDGFPMFTNVFPRSVVRPF